MSPSHYVVRERSPKEINGPVGKVIETTTAAGTADMEMDSRSHKTALGFVFSMYNFFSSGPFFLEKKRGATDETYIAWAVLE